MKTVVVVFTIADDYDVNDADEALRATGVYGAQFVTEPSAGDLQDLF